MGIFLSSATFWASREESLDVLDMLCPLMTVSVWLIGEEV